MGIVVIGASFVDVKGYPLAQYIPGGRNVGRVVQVHGGVARNVVEDIANVELRPTFLSVVDDTGLSDDVVRNLIRHKVDIRYIARSPEGLGTWLAVFDNDGDVIASISRRPDLSAIEGVLEKDGDEIFRNADSIVVEFDIEVPILKKVLDLAEKHGKEVYTVISNMSIAMKRRDLLRKTAALVCNAQEAGMLFAEDYTDMRPEDMKKNLADRIRKSGIPRIIVTMGGYDRRRRCIFCRHSHRAHIRQDGRGGLHDRNQACGVGDRFEGECLPQIPAGGVRDCDRQG